MTTVLSPEPTATVDELLAAYADDPTSLTAAERSAVEARCAADPALARELEELRAMLTEVRGHGDVADHGPDWSALEATIRAAVTPAPRQVSRWIAGAGLALAAAAAVALWTQRRGGDGLDPAQMVAAAIARLPEVAPIERAPVAPAAEDVAIVDEDVDGEDAELAAIGLDDPADEDEAIDDEVLIGRALEAVPVAEIEDGMLPGLDTAWVEDLSDVEVAQALRWLEQQGAG